MAKLTALGHIGLGIETTFGTAVAPTFWLPYKTVKAADVIHKVTDDGRRANVTKDYAVYNTTQEGTVEIDGMAYPDALGYFVFAMLGSDAVTGTAVPYTHTLKLLNNLPPTLTLSNYSGVDERQYAGAAINALDIKFDTADKQMDVSAKFNTLLGVVGTTSTPTYSTLSPFLGFQLAPTINSVLNTNVVGGEINYKRTVAMLYTVNDTQAPTKFSSSEIEVTGKLTFDIESATEYDLYTTGTQFPLSLKFTQSANSSATFEFGNVDITKSDLDQSQQYLRVNMEWKALYNTGDAGPSTVTLTNSLATAY